MTTGGRTYFYLTDAIGSVVALADADGNKVNSYAYSPRGVRLVAQSSEPVAQPHRFAGNYQDPTGLYHLQHRYYDANIGRFTQPDPSGQEKNPYLHAEGDPVNRIDPNGLLSFGDVADWLEKSNDWVGAAVGCVAGIEAAASTGTITSRRAHPRPVIRTGRPALSAAETGIIAAASTFGPWGTAAAVGVGCVVGGLRAAERARSRCGGGLDAAYHRSDAPTTPRPSPGHQDRQPGQQLIQTDRGGQMSDKTKLVAFVIVGFVVSAIVLVYGLQTGEVVPLALAAVGFPSASVLTFLMIRHSRRGS